MVSSDVVLGELVELVPSMLFGMSVAGILTYLPFFRPSMPSSGVAPGDTTFVAILPLFIALAFFGLNII